jgi:hypothetical protein
MPTINTSTAGPLKRELIELAFGDLGSAGYEFGRTPEEIADALSRLNAIMAEWPWNALSYNAPLYGAGNADDYSGISGEAVNAVTAMLALRLAPIMGATLSPEARFNLVSASNKIYALTASINTMPFDRHTPRGMGSEHKFGIGFVSPFIEECDTDDTTSCDDD